MATFSTIYMSDIVYQPWHSVYDDLMIAHMHAIRFNYYSSTYVPL